MINVKQLFGITLLLIRVKEETEKSGKDFLGTLEYEMYFVARWLVANILNAGTAIDLKSIKAKQLFLNVKKSSEEIQDAYFSKVYRQLLDYVRPYERKTRENENSTTRESQGKLYTGASCKKIARKRSGRYSTRN